MKIDFRIVHSLILEHLRLFGYNIESYILEREFKSKRHETKNKLSRLMHIVSKGMEQVKDMSLLNSKESHSSSSRSKSSSSSERNPPVAVVEPQRNDVEETKFKQRKKETSVNGKNASPLLGQKMTAIKALNKNNDQTKRKYSSNGRSRIQQHHLLDHSTTENSIEVTTNDESLSGSANQKNKRKMSLTQKNPHSDNKRHNKSSKDHNKSTIILNHSEESSIEPQTGPLKTEASPQNAGAGSFYPSIGYVTPPKTKTSMTAYYHSSLAAGYNGISKEQKPLNPSRSKPTTVHPPDHHISLINSFIETTKKEPLPKIKNETKPLIRSPPEALTSKNPTNTKKSPSSIIKVEEGGSEKVNNNFDESRRNSNQFQTIPGQNNNKKSFYVSGLINKQPSAGPELFSKPPKQGKPQRLNIDKEVLEHLLIRSSMKEPEIMQLFEVFESLLEETKSPGQFMDKRRFKEYLKRTANIHGDDFIDCVFRHGSHLLLTTDRDWIAFKEAVVILDKLNQDSPFSIMNFVFKLSIVPNEKKSSLSLVRSLLQEIRVANKTGMVSLLLDSLDYIHTYENISRLTLLSFEEYLELVKRYQPMRRFS